MMRLDADKKFMYVNVEEGIRIPWSYLLSVFDKSSCNCLCVLNASMHYKSIKIGVAAARHAIRVRHKKWDVIENGCSITVYNPI